MSNVTIDVQTKYWSWDNYPYAWDEANSSWDEAYDRIYTLTASETLETIDLNARKQVKFSKEIATVGSGFAKNALFSRSVSEVARLTEEKHIYFVNRLFAYLGVFDGANKEVYCLHDSVLGISETHRGFGLTRAFPETYGFSETYWDNISFFINSAESFTASDSNSRKNVFDRTISDKLAVVESLGRAFSFHLNDYIAAKDTLNRSAGYNRNGYEGFSITESSNRKVRQVFEVSFGTGEGFERPILAKGFYDYIGLQEAFSVKYVARHANEFGITEEHFKNVKFVRNPKELCVIREFQHKALSASMDDGFVFSELASKIVAVGFEENSAVADYRTISFNLDKQEEADVADGVVKSLDIISFDDFGVSDDSRNSINTSYGYFFRVDDDNAKELSVKLFATLKMSDLVANNVDKLMPVESFLVGDGAKNVARFTRSTIDSLGIIDYVTKSLDYNLQDWIGIDDGLARSVAFLRALSEKFSVSETYWDNIAFYLGVSEAIVTQEELRNSFQVPLSDQMTVSDLLAKHYETYKDEALVGVAENLLKQVLFCRNSQENFKTADEKLGSKMRQTKTEPLNISEVLGKFFDRGVEEEALLVNDDFKGSIHYLRRLLENMGISDQKLGSKICNFNSDVLSFKDIMGRIFNLPVIEALKLTDEAGRQVVYSMVLNEALNLAEQKMLGVGKSMVDNVKVSEGALRKRLESFSVESFKVMDELLREYIARRFVDETVSVEDYLIKGARCFMSEEMNTYDTLIKACEGILSNLSIKEGELTLDEFLEIVDKPPNYTKFIEFKVGEYDYKEALVRIVMATQVRQTKPMISNAVMHVDIPDTDDKGEVEITDTTVATKVYFNKFYYNPPTVNVTLKGGNTGDGVLVPNIVSTDKSDEGGRYFEVEIWDETWSERKTGRLSWVSKGY